MPDSRRYPPEMVERVRALYRELGSADKVSAALGGAPGRTWVRRHIADLTRGRAHGRRYTASLASYAVRLYDSGLTQVEVLDRLHVERGVRPSTGWLSHHVERAGVRRTSAAAQARRFARQRATIAEKIRRGLVEKARGMARAGVSNREIAAALGEKPTTVRTWTKGYHQRRRMRRYRILELRLVEGLNQKAISERLGIPASTVSYYLQSEGLGGASKRRKAA